jgi:hypothetical protein
MAFANCLCLTSIHIPASVIYIDSRAFPNNASLTNITVSAHNSSYKDIDGVLFSKDGTILINYPLGKDNPVVSLPDSIINIGEYAFAGNNNLVSIIVPSSVKYIDNNAFDHCTALTNVTISDGVTIIGASAFYWCTSLTDITVPGSVTSVGNYAFYQCSSLTNATMLDGVINIGTGVFAGCFELESIILPESVMSIGDGAFYGCVSWHIDRFGGTSLPEYFTKCLDPVVSCPRDSYTHQYCLKNDVRFRLTN